ncbi:MAG: hypothetical protein IKO91_04830 [Oscillospiraceae bacterium]|nr:hypothetical protein [Oscillospiraceae bacterium]
MRRFKEPLKTALLILLTLSAAFLAWRGRIFGGLFPEPEPETTPPQEEEILSCSPAALPSVLVLTGVSGLHCGVKYDAEEMSRLFDLCSPILAEALGSAEKPSPIPEKEFRNRLEGAGLYLDFGFSLPVSVLAAWVGVDVLWAEEASGSAFLLDSDPSGSIRLCFTGEEGEYLSSITAASRLSMEALLEDTLPNGAVFAFSLPELKNSAPYSLVLDELPELRAVNGAGGLEEAASALAEHFGINLSGTSRYTEADGTLVYPGETGVLRLDAGGSISFSAAEGAMQTRTDSLSERIELVRRLLETVHETYAAEERLSLIGLSWEDEVLSLTFGYEVGGIPVLLSGGAAAWAEWGPEGLRELTVFPRRYRRGEPVSGLLPEKQAAAASGSLYPGSGVRLILSDSGQSRLALSWAVTEEGELLWMQED